VVFNAHYLTYLAEKTPIPEWARAGLEPRHELQAA
jgi:hypothetical protein